MIKIQAIGHLGRDCEVREVNGQYAISFSIAHSSKYTNQEGVLVDRATWISCTIWKRKDQSIKISDYLVKGQLLYVEGIPHAEWYQDREGKVVAQLRLRVTNTELLGGARQSEATAKPLQGNYAAGSTDQDDDLPF